jgi:pimeloyl-ACP methyl ester carboxylesterase
MHNSDASRFSKRFPSLAIALSLIALTSCATHGEKQEYLMPTPILFSAAKLDPFGHLPGEELTPDITVAYATNRIPKGPATDPQYGNGMGTTLHLGEALVRFGGQDMTWEKLDEASRTPPPESSDADVRFRDPDIPLFMNAAEEMGAFETASLSGAPDSLTTGQQQFVNALNERLDMIPDPQLILYVHGAKQSFSSSVVFTGQVNHFLGRDLVGVAFAWPVHQDIIRYGIGVDVSRADDTAEPLAEFIEFLAAHTNAERINIVSWSAGGRVMSKALEVLRTRYSALDSDTLRNRFRLGLVIFAAADVPKVDFIERLPGIHDVSGRVVVMMSDDDGALRMGRVFMQGGERTGMINEDEVDPDYEARLVARLDRLEILDVSHFQEERGFDITGHAYWWAHPWTNTDVLVHIRTLMSAEERGLAPTGYDRVWGFPLDYPARAEAAVNEWVTSRPENERLWRAGPELE